jgi:hypothetical protein
VTSLTRHLEQLQAEIQKRGPDSDVLGIPAFPLAYELMLAIQLVKARIDEINLTPPTPIVITDPEHIAAEDCGSGRMLRLCNDPVWCNSSGKCWLNRKDGE